jgi:hypothetical protein
VEVRFRLTRMRVAALAALAALMTAGGIGYAAIPDGGKTLNACMANATGTLRLVDPDAPAHSLVRRPCNTRYETAVSWNQQGIQGLQGDRGPAGPPGDGAATAYALIGPDGKVDATRSKGITQANVTAPLTGAICISGLPFEPKSISVTPAAGYGMATAWFGGTAGQPSDRTFDNCGGEAQAQALSGDLYGNWGVVSLYVVLQ